MFDLHEDIFDENKIEERELNCPCTITVPSRLSHNLMITKIRWSFQHAFWLTANIYPIDKPARPIILDIKRHMFALPKLFITLTIYKKHPEPLLTQHDIHSLRGLMDTAKIHMGTHTSYYKQEIKEIVQHQSNQKSSFLVVPEVNLCSWWCQHLFLIAGGASLLPFFTGGANVY